MSFLTGGGGGGGSAKTQPIPAPVPTRSVAEVEAEAASERQRRALAGGRASTLLVGTTDTPRPSAAKTLLGAG